MSVFLTTYNILEQVIILLKSIAKQEKHFDAINKKTGDHKKIQVKTNNIIQTVNSPAIGYRINDNESGNSICITVNPHLTTKKSQFNKTFQKETL